MATLVPVAFEDGTTIWVEGADSAPLPGATRIREAGAVDAAEMALATAHQIAGSIRGFCGRVIGSLDELGPGRRPASAKIEFGLNISLEGNVYIVKSSGEATIKITAEWKLTDGVAR